MRTFRCTTSFAAFVLATPLAAQQLPPVRPLGAVAAKSTETFLSPSVGIRPLPGGKVLVHDQFGRKVVLLDAALATAQVVADTTAATGNAYSGRIAGLLPYRGDSSLFVDPQSLSMLVIDPSGKVGRVMSVPRSQDAMALVGVQGNPGLDAAGRIVYRGMPMPRFQGGPPGAGGPMAPDFPDSAAIQRIDLATRALDTVGFIKTPKIRMNVNRSDDGRVSMSSIFNPLPVVDDWAVLSDGTIALVRGKTYHVDFIDPDGTRRSAAKVPFEWQRLTDEQKVAFIDSVKVVRARTDSIARANVAAGTATGSAPMPMEGGGMRIEMRVGGPPPAGGAARREGETRIMGPGGGGMNLTFVDASELPDYRPAFFQGQVRADRDANLWVRTTNFHQGAPIYDVINRKGELIDRVAVPAGRTIAGFGEGGVVYLVGRDGTKTVLERASVR
ncbi:MAG TPA: hypothetical protein VEA99_04940 [Gemmatimonadaceae bacterium]|nr:hypothetical protein [Gemmatimonadaceae bacterium]